MFELRCLMAVGSVYCCLNSFYYLYLLSTLIINPIVPFMLLNISAIFIHLTASSLMGLKMLEMAISTPINTPSATLSVAKTLPFFLYAEGTARLLSESMMVLIMHKMTFTIAATMGMGIACIFLASILYKFNQNHLGNPTFPVNDPELAALPNGMGFAT